MKENNKNLQKNNQILNKNDEINIKKESTKSDIDYLMSKLTV